LRYTQFARYYFESLDTSTYTLDLLPNHQLHE